MANWFSVRGRRFSALGLVFGCLFVALLHNRYLLEGATTVAILAIVIGIPRWVSYIKKTVRPSLKVTCPLCGGAVHFETSPLPDIQIYLVCPQCNQCADTGFKVPYRRRMGGRYAMGYNWETRKMMPPTIIVHPRVLRRRQKKGEAKLS